MTRRSPESSSSETLKQKVLKFGTAASIGLLALTGCGDKTEAVDTSSSQGVEQSQGAEPTSEAYTIPNNTDIRELDMTAEQYQQLPNTLASPENTKTNPEISAIAAETEERVREGMIINYDTTSFSGTNDERAKKVRNDFMANFENVVNNSEIEKHYSSDKEFFDLAFKSYGDEYAMEAHAIGMNYDTYRASLDYERDANGQPIGLGAGQAFTMNKLIQKAYVEPTLAGLGATSLESPYTVAIHDGGYGNSETFGYGALHQAYAQLSEEAMGLSTYDEGFSVTEIDRPDSEKPDAPVIGEGYTQIGDYPQLLDVFRFTSPSGSRSDFALSIEMKPVDESDPANVKLAPTISEMKW